MISTSHTCHDPSEKVSTQKTMNLLPGKTLSSQEDAANNKGTTVLPVNSLPLQVYPFSLNATNLKIFFSTGMSSITTAHKFLQMTNPAQLLISERHLLLRVPLVV